MVDEWIIGLALLFGGFNTLNRLFNWPSGGGGLLWPKLLWTGRVLLLGYFEVDATGGGWWFDCAMAE